MSTDFNTLPSFGELSEMLPAETGVSPVLGTPRSEIRAVTFDIYGTLFISGSGDISLTLEGSREEALRESLVQGGLRWSRKPTAKESLSDRFHQEILTAQEKRKAGGITWPEVEIREVWKNFLSRLVEDGIVSSFPGEQILERIALDYEFRVNPVWPMPGLLEVLTALRLRNLPLGIVSNAQFYTPLLFPLFLDQDLSQLGFCEDLQVWSYREREGKPSPALYEKLASRLLSHQLEPSQVLYVGNDMRNDIAPAQKIGFQTALFAGDQRSLRWREEDPLVEGISPDFILTDLRQILELCLLDQ